MVDQYIYTRTERPGRAVGQGFASRTAGIVGAVQNSVQALTNQSYTMKDGEGHYLPVWTKAALQDRKEKVVFQQAVKEETEDGLCSLYHGYVLDQAAELFLYPERWGGFRFCSSLSQLPGSLEGERAAEPGKTPLRPLAQVLAFFRLTTTDLIRLVQSCFEAKQGEELVLVAVDYSRPEAQLMAMQLLMWLFRFLPMAMRRSVDCTTCLGSGWNSSCAVGLVSAGQVTVRDGKLSLNMGAGFLANGTILFADGKLERTSGKGGRPQGGGLFCQWLDSLAGWVAKQPPQQAERTMEALNQVYLRFDTMIASLPEGDRCKVNYYDALCWTHLVFDRDEPGRRVPARSDLTCFEDLLAFGSWPSVLRSVGKMLDAMESLYVTPASAQLIRLMTKIVRLDGVDDNLSQARELLTAFLSKDMEAAELGESSAVSAKYLQLMTTGGMARTEALEFLERSFFPAEFPSEGECGWMNLWKRVGTSRLQSEGYRRCSDWVGGYCNLCLNADELMDCAETIIRELDGFQPGRLGHVLDCLLGAQEARCYYAKLEILPSHLTTCCRYISGVRKQLPQDYWEVAESYYTKLFLQLCREYLRCWEGRHTLAGICELMAEFQREGLRRTENSLLRDLIVAQCSGICEYDWETLKERMAGEGSTILARLWKILDQLDDFWLEDDLADRLCSQVCRYLLHGLPSYVSDSWLLRQVKPRGSLKRQGYYLELLALREFLSEEEQTLESLQKCIRKYHVPAGAMQDMMKFLFRLFGRGGLRDLEPVALQGIYLASGKRLKVSQLEVFRVVSKVQSGEALLELLRQWPSAPPEEELSGHRLRKVKGLLREGTYPWLKTDEAFLSALEALSKEEETLRQAAAETENFFFRLMEEVNLLVPVGTAGRSGAVRINRNLMTLLEKESSLATRMLCGSKKRRLLAE